MKTYIVGASIEYSYHMFSRRNKKNIFKESYDMKGATKEWSIAEKILTPAMGIEPGPPG